MQLYRFWNKAIYKTHSDCNNEEKLTCSWSHDTAAAQDKCPDPPGAPETKNTHIYTYIYIHIYKTKKKKKKKNYIYIYIYIGV